MAEELTTLVAGQLARVMGLAHRHLDVDVMFVADLADGRQMYGWVQGRVGWYPVGDDAGMLRQLRLTEETHTPTAMGVPVRLDDGTVFGSLCCLRDSPRPFRQRDLHFLRMLADLVASELTELITHTKARDRIAALLEHKHLTIALQPIFDVHDGTCLGVEALSRFPPGYGQTQQIFESAYRVGLGLPLERLALGRAIEAAPLLDPKCYLSVNLTPAVVHALAWAVERQAGLMPNLVLEITEHAAVESYARLRDTLKLARELGLRLAIDDAGAGYASLKHVIELEPDIIKIDRSLVDGVADDRARRSVVSAFVLLALDQGSSVVAEGVEREVDLDAIRDLGVDAAQGYLLARPTVDRSELRSWLHDGSATADTRSRQLIS